MPLRVQRTAYEKGKPAGRKFITREQQGYHLESEFFGAVTGQKESARNRLVVFTLMAATCGRRMESERE